MKELQDKFIVMKELQDNFIVISELHDKFIVIILTVNIHTMYENIKFISGALETEKRQICSNDKIHLVFSYTVCILFK